jgi:hypothetical protein
MIYALFDNDGFILGFYPTDIHPIPPDGAVEITKDDYNLILNNHRKATKYQKGRIVVDEVLKSEIEAAQSQPIKTLDDIITEKVREELTKHDLTFNREI